MVIESLKSRIENYWRKKCEICDGVKLAIGDTPSKNKVSQFCTRGYQSRNVITKSQMCTELHTCMGNRWCLNSQPIHTLVKLHMSYSILVLASVG